MTRYINATDTAKIIRRKLAETFPGQRFSVTSKSYSMGASISIKWTDGPTEDEVESITGQFEGADFDGSIDLKSYHDSYLNGERVHFGADYVFCSRFLSEAATAIVRAEFDREFPGGIWSYDPFYGESRIDDETMQREFRRMALARSFYVHPDTQRDGELMHEYRDF